MLKKETKLKLYLCLLVMLIGLCRLAFPLDIYDYGNTDNKILFQCFDNTEFCNNFTGKLLIKNNTNVLIEENISSDIYFFTYNISNLSVGKYTAIAYICSNSSLKCGSSSQDFKIENNFNSGAENINNENYLMWIIFLIIVIIFYIIGIVNQNAILGVISSIGLLALGIGFISFSSLMATITIGIAIVSIMYFIFGVKH